MPGYISAAERTFSLTLSSRHHRILRFIYAHQKLLFIEA